MTDGLTPIQEAQFYAFMLVAILLALAIATAPIWMGDIDTGLTGEHTDAANVCEAVHGDGYEYAGSYERINETHLRAFCERTEKHSGGVHIRTVVVSEG